MMYEYDEECLKTFLKNQSQLFDEPVAESIEEAEAFLEDCMAAVEERLPRMLQKHWTARFMIVRSSVLWQKSSVCKKQIWKV